MSVDQRLLSSPTTRGELLFDSRISTCPQIVWRFFQLFSSQRTWHSNPYRYTTTSGAVNAKTVGSRNGCRRWETDSNTKMKYCVTTQKICAGEVSCQSAITNSVIIRFVRIFSRYWRFVYYWFFLVLISFLMNSIDIRLRVEYVGKNRPVLQWHHNHFRVILRLVAVRNCIQIMHNIDEP
jgi:hypothetical protein